VAAMKNAAACRVVDLGGSTSVSFIITADSRSQISAVSAFNGAGAVSVILGAHIGSRICLPKMLA
jgi:hypothetical protein